jgi:hypothetical protein
VDYAIKYDRPEIFKWFVEDMGLDDKGGLRSSSVKTMFNEQIWATRRELMPKQWRWPLSVYSHRRDTQEFVEACNPTVALVCDCLLYSPLSTFYFFSSGLGIHFGPNEPSPAVTSLQFDPVNCETV